MTTVAEKIRDEINAGTNAKLCGASVERRCKSEEEIAAEMFFLKHLTPLIIKTGIQKKSTKFFVHCDPVGEYGKMVLGGAERKHGIFTESLARKHGPEMVPE